RRKLIKTERSLSALDAGFLHPWLAATVWRILLFCMKHRNEPCSNWRTPPRASTARPPGRIGFPIAGHDRTGGDHFVDHLPKGVARDLRPHRGGALVGLRQLRQIGLTAVEARIDAVRQRRLVVAQESLAAHVAAGAMRRKAERVLVVPVLQHQD